MPIKPELIDELLKDGATPDILFGNDGLLQQLTKAILERALQGELTHHLGYEKHAPEGKNSGNSRNGSYPKTLRSKRGQVSIEVPRDRQGEFQPQRRCDMPMPWPLANTLRSSDWPVMAKIPVTNRSQKQKSRPDDLL